MKFKEIYNLVFDDKELLMEVPHIAIPLAYSLDRDENYFDAKIEKIPDNSSQIEIVDHFVHRFKKRRLNKMQREKVYSNITLNTMMNLKFKMDFETPVSLENENSMSIKDRIEFEFDYIVDSYD